MKATLLLRAASASIQTSFIRDSSRFHASNQDPGAGVSFSGKNSTPRFDLKIIRKTKGEIPDSIRRSVSDTELFRPGMTNLAPRASAKLYPTRIREDEDLLEETYNLNGGGSKNEGSLTVKPKGLDLCVPEHVGGILPKKDVSEEELEFSGGGLGKGKKTGDGNGGGKGSTGHGSFSGGNADQHKIGAYYQQMLKANPENPLLLRNYGRFLHEVEKDYAGAEECYGRAILASPGDADVLSLYGRLIWETQRDQRRAESYFDQAVKACPDDCYVLGSYAHFLWDAEDEDEGVEDTAAANNSPAFVEAY